MAGNPGKEKAVETLLFMKPLIEEAVACKDPYLSEEFLEKHHIVISGLDLSSGEPVKKSSGANVAQQFIKPLSLAVVEEILSKTKPWLTDELIEERDEDPYEEAESLLCFFMSYMTRSPGNQAGFVDFTNWGVRHLEWKRGEYLYSKDRNARWSVRNIIDRWTRGKDLTVQEDGRTSHIACFLIDTARLKPGKISKAEMHCIIFLTISRLNCYRYNAHCITPVTIVSISDRQFRIVQGYADKREGCVHVAMSDIIDYEEEDRIKTMLVLSWAAGDPVGNTKY